MKTYTLERLMDLTEAWLVTGDLEVEMLALNFQFISPFWKSNSKDEFVDTFRKSTVYKDKSLSNIVRFDPVLKFKGMDGRSFSIVLQYHTKNGSSVYEAVLGVVADGLLVELRSIYDLEATKKALEL